MESRNGIIQNGGINRTPHTWDSKTGYSRPMKGFMFMKITDYTDRGFYSLYDLLDEIYFNRNKNEFLGNLLSDMSPYTFLDTKSADPAAYLDYEHFLKPCVEDSKREDAKTAFSAAMKFLEFYRDEFGFEIDDVIKSITFDEYEEIFKNIKSDS